MPNPEKTFAHWWIKNSAGRPAPSDRCRFHIHRLLRDRPAETARLRSAAYGRRKGRQWGRAMTPIEPSNIALFWAGVIAVAILVYVILDGFDLGVGVLFGTTRQPRLRSQMMAAISPFWDGNETWLVVIGASLFAAFPVVYAVFLAAFYIPVLLLVLGLISRGIAFEFRNRGGAGGLGNWGFFIGSTVAAFVQGAAVGAMIRGIPVANNQYAGGSFEWLRPFPVVCGIGLVLGYALLGAGWLVLKSERTLADWAWRRIPWLAGAALAVVCVAFIIALGDRDRISGALHERTWGLVFPLLASWRYTSSS
jgi:cytochrome d ubiquinol oxidase subunit II